MTQDEELDRNGIELCFCEIEGILDVLIYIRVEAEPVQHLALNDACVTLLHLGKERLKKAGAKLGRPRVAA
ncbi:hypothetical protein MESS2_620011 [Mesorhizobium metallidurans STM 2683]|uniref:Uncharacterized protein n=1 Tax=Mesorhizobium metallidurans STM 2683 TaxID=1297569 RepID=M5ETU6_9HYPH|nr:hypothetical protein [Mesorhizobium metallidurans]CCV07667.1 hypothetical protein MESS2_620011 [Mesorhizobium metallidurans STM 2683]